MENNTLTKQDLNDLSGIILDSALTVHREMGPGLMESVYHECLILELRNRGLHVEREVQVKLQYQNVPIDKEYRIDILIEGEVIVELKAVEAILKVPRSASC